MNYLLNILVVCEIYVILALAMNLLAGDAGLLSMSQATFYGIGAYVVALLLVKGHFTFIPAILVAMVFNLVACIPVIWFSLRLRDLFFTLATLSWQIMVFSVLYNWMPVTNGSIGIIGIPRPRFWGLDCSGPAAFALFGGAITLLVLAFFLWFRYTPLARLIQGVRDDQLALMALGKKPAYYKALAIFLSSGVSALSGGLFATYFSFVDPTSFNLDESILIISVVLIGGLGSLRGALAGALFYVLLPEVLRFVHIPDSLAANVRMMIYAMMLILVVRYRPHGFFGKYRFE